MLFYQYLQNNSEGVNFAAIAKPEWERGDHMTPLKRHWSMRSWSPPASTPSTPPRTRPGDFRAMQMLDWFIKEQGEGGEERRRPYHQDGAVRRRQQGVYMLKQRAEGTVYTAPSLVLCAPSGRGCGPRIRQKADHTGGLPFSSGRRLETTNCIKQKGNQSLNEEKRPCWINSFAPAFMTSKPSVIPPRSA